MAGIRVGGTAILSGPCSPPFGAFEGTDGDGDANVYKACVGDASGLATMYSDFNDGGVTSEGVRGARISPDGTKILFELDHSTTGFTEIWVVANAPGSTATPVVADASNWCWSPEWGPDSDTFVYARGAAGAYTGGTIEKDTVSSPGTPVTLKSAGGGKSPYRPQFNFDGTRVAYIFDTDLGGTGELRVCDDDGTNDASIDNAVRYRFQGPQISWANSMNVIAYEDGVSGLSAGSAYVINDDGSGKVQINANGSAAGSNARISDRAWPADDSYVVFGSEVIGLPFNPIRAELDGSNTTTLNASHGAWNQAYFQYVIVANNRLWWIEDTNTVAGCAIDGTDYTVYLTIDGAAMDDFSTGDGWSYN